MEDIQRQLPTESAKFKTVDKWGNAKGGGVWWDCFFCLKGGLELFFQFFDFLGVVLL